MPRKNTPENRAKIRAYQRKWYAKKAGEAAWSEKKTEQRKRGKKRAKDSGRYNEERQHQLDHLYRLRVWEQRRLSPLEKDCIRQGMRFGYARREANPRFTVIGKDGRRHTEMLFGPLPTW